MADDEEEEEGEMLMVVDQLVEIKSLEHSLDCGFSPVASEQQNGFSRFPPLSVPWCHGGGINVAVSSFSSRLWGHK